MNEQPLLLSCKQAAALLGLSSRSIFNLMRDGRLHRVRIGNRTLVRRTDVETLALTGSEGNIRQH